jgi:hypothetical protein
MAYVLVDRHGQAFHEAGRTLLPPSADFRQVNGWCTSRILALQMPIIIGGAACRPGASQGSTQTHGATGDGAGYRG